MLQRISLVFLQLLVFQLLLQLPVSLGFSLSNNKDLSMGSQQEQQEQEQLIVCSYCEAKFPSRSQLFKHLRAKHDLDALLEEESTGSTLQNLSPSQRTAASVAARSVYYNAAQDAYYRAQVAAGVFSISDWEEAQEYFRRPLPVAFRMLTQQHKSSDWRFAFWERLQHLSPAKSLQSCPALDPHLAKTAVIPPRQWSPEAQQALMDAQEVGVANRQELCSMIPPLLLLQDGDVLQGRGTVLDLCAAPGSKSLQLMDMLQRVQIQPHSNAASNDIDNNKNTSQQDSTCTAMLVANDANRQRLMTVARRSRRFPATGRPSLILNSSDGRYFPALRMCGGYKVKFDRILADVPCSGDGTLRKLSKKEWQQWNVKSHLQLHTLQVRLLTRALECVKKGGRVVYSTCSLDPIEDEAVVVSAIARRGGPRVYRICPIPDRLCPTATEPLAYSPGATHWVVPHPQFGKTNAKANTTYDETYQSIDQVPAMHRKKDIRPSMFPPKARTEKAVAQVLDHDPEKLALARKFGEILSPEDVDLYETMLPNCARIFPQHLDSGGFFCAVIERVAPAYYPVCYPLERKRREQQQQELSSMGDTASDSHDADTAESQQQQEELIYKYHGRILTNVQSAQHMRELLVKDKAQGDEVIFEGVATRDLAVKWLQNHRAFIPGISEQLLTSPARSANNEDSDDDDQEAGEKGTPDVNNKPARKRHVNDPTKSFMYTRLFPPPHPSLVQEFVDFFGLKTCPQEASQAGVEPFPVERLVIRQGGDDAVNVTSCMDPDEAHTLVPWDNSEDFAAKNKGSITSNTTKIPRKRRFFHLVLISEQIRNLFKGGAKFSPMEVGLSLCWVPVPGQYREAPPGKTVHQPDTNEENKEATRFEDSAARAAQSGRYGLLDEAAEFLAHRATKRIVGLAQSQALQLLEAGHLSVQSTTAGELATSSKAPSGSRWGQQRLGDLTNWSMGAAIAVVTCGWTDGDGEQPCPLFMPCVLKQQEALGRHLSLVAELRLADAWKRLLQASPDEK
ncbi:Multisite-specific tRNA:(cytosine-C(5))-methyltransferase trm4a [Seminavis robusta]|uniref:Multisite-specific tRNA:(Cytosine-C(5))-methyltransferase trm4a n=1 Tax=Seminavis robusta TaxID=568900 RepID=A0A9N8DEN5_9STRA|nr:Multisite-specific tRNA:(cytosine-C(5))-methyltransferase trm4a [Seminavis robusta]|eukprot:Sro107_g053980.1 Multisite-specific tRNA:(cytosine-C(5))-methyltransferase trm4a (1018) ;mRNA; r:92168-95221